MCLVVNNTQSGSTMCQQFLKTRISRQGWCLVCEETILLLEASTTQGGREYWSGLSIAALFSVAKIVNKREVVRAYTRLPNKEFGRNELFPLTLPDLPFLVPTQELVDRAHLLQYRTVVPERRDNRWQLRTLNKTEIDAQLGLFLVERGVSSLWRGYARARREQMDVQRYVVEYK